MSGGYLSGGYLSGGICPRITAAICQAIIDWHTSDPPVPKQVLRMFV